MRHEAPIPQDPEARDRMRLVNVGAAAANGQVVHRQVADYLERRAEPLEVRVAKAKVALKAGEEATVQYLLGEDTAA